MKENQQKTLIFLIIIIDKQTENNYLSYKIFSKRQKKSFIKYERKFKRKMKKIEHHGLLDRHIVQINGLYSKIIKKDENVIIINFNSLIKNLLNKFLGKFMIRFECIINKN